jgi:hypothetical protein
MVRRERERFASGRSVVWRSRPSGEVGYVFGCRVLLDEPEVVALVQSTGSPIMRRIAERGGPNGRSLIPGTWDGSRRLSRWERPPAVRLHPVGRGYAVIRTWLAHEGRFDGWYVNLEQPWPRTPVGFDTRDDVLDVTVSDDLSEWQLKDADELEFAVEVGVVTAIEAESIRAAAESAIDDIARRAWPFNDAAWWDALPSSTLRPAKLPDAWDAVSLPAPPGQ